VLLTNRLLTSLRYDHLDAGGLLSERKGYSILGIQVKYYLRSNIALYVRNDLNTRQSEGGVSAVRNFRNAVLIGGDFVF